MATLSDTSAKTSSDFGGSSGSSSGSFWDNFNTELLMKFIQVLEAVLILVVAYFITRWLKKKFERFEIQHENQRTALNLLEKVTNGFVIIIGITLALKTLGLDISLLVSVGLLGLSYGLKDLMKNYVAGILIFFKSPFKIGDIVKIKQYTGRVEKMDLQSISLKTFDNRDVTIYNADIMIQSVANYSRYPMRRMEIDVKLGYGSDVNRAIRIFDKILANENLVLKNPKYSIIFKKFTDTSVVVQLKFWVQMPANVQAIRSNIALQIQQAFDDSFIFIPYSRAIEDENDHYTKNEDNKTRIKNFYDQPLLSDLKTPQPQGFQPPQLAPEIIDAEEPPEDDLGF